MPSYKLSGLCEQAQEYGCGDILNVGFGLGIIDKVPLAA